MEKKQLTYFMAVLPFLVMLLFIIVGYVILGLKIELMLASAAFIAGVVAWKIGYSWNEMQEEICRRMKKITPAVLIMWSVGIVIGTFMFSGSIPLIIYYGLQLVNPKYLIAFSFVITLVLATVTGTSWGSAGTVGVAMIGVATGLGVSVPMVAGAVISGAIFGDKMSPLSDTTNLCPAATGGVDLYEHIKHMQYTTWPAAGIALILYIILGFSSGSTTAGGDSGAEAMINCFGEIYHFSALNNILMLIPLLIVLGGAALKKPTPPTMLLGSVVAIVVGMICHGFTLANGSTAAIAGFSGELTNMDPEAIDAAVSTLITRGGMKGMVGIITIIYSGYAFTALWSMTGGISMTFKPIISKVNTRASVVTSAVVITTILDGACGTSYVPAIIVPELFREKYINLNMKLKNLSRTLEDAGTCLNPIWPWSMSGIFFASTFGFATTFTYVPFAFLCYLTPFIAIFCGLTGFGIHMMSDEEKEAELKRIHEDE